MNEGEDIRTWRGNQDMERKSSNMEEAASRQMGKNMNNMEEKVSKDIAIKIKRTIRNVGHDPLSKSN